MLADVTWEETYYNAVIEPAHGVVFGQKKRARVCNKLRDGATWVVTPLKF